MKLFLIDDTKTNLKCVSGAGRFQVIFKKRILCIVYFFQKSSRYCYDLPSLKHVIIHNIEFSCSNRVKRARFETCTCPLVLFISDRANENTHIEMHACWSRFHQQELEPFSHFACFQHHSTFSWASLQKDQRACCVAWRCLLRSRFLGCHATPITVHVHHISIAWLCHAISFSFSKKMPFLP